ncbi:MAG: hypothetical protein L0Z49_03875 [Actinobacteria bacterium]|nr:hypothetical protein [Actinomycetota bacterium]MCI0543571.1 hypothetical protein [Actinomycetota bacterium]MCI0677511.1 hypothetical protein [Actinomycetota bacterium]
MTISRADIEAKARELIGAVEDTKRVAKNKGMWGAALVAGVVITAFVVGRRRGGRNKTVVEVYRV